jgi:hypothetical protein
MHFSDYRKLPISKHPLEARKQYASEMKRLHSSKMKKGEIVMVNLRGKNVEGVIQQDITDLETSLALSIGGRLIRKDLATIYGFKAPTVVISAKNIKSATKLGTLPTDLSGFTKVKSVKKSTTIQAKSTKKPMVKKGGIIETKAKAKPVVKSGGILQTKAKAKPVVKSGGILQAKVKKKQQKKQLIKGGDAPVMVGKKCATKERKDGSQYTICY